MKDLIKIENVHGEFLTTSKNVAEVFGKDHKNVLQSIERLECSQKFKELSFQPTSYRNGQNKIHPMYLITKDGFAMLAMGFTGKKAMKFKEKYITAFNKMESVIFENDRLADPNLASINYIANALRVNEGSRIQMFQKCLTELGHHAAIKALPDYTEEGLTKPISELLKDHNVKLSAVKANKMLVDLGILEIKTRNSSKGKTKNFKSLTESGLEYGKNLISPHNQKEVQPHYFVETFKDLVESYFS